MAESQVTMFSSEVIEKLGTYVYRLIDPRNGETFYIGKGKGNRVFAHVLGKISEEENDGDDKMQRIRAIRNAGFDVVHVIHRHGMSDEVAFEVEGALIDAFPGLSNLAGGAGNSEIGAMHAQQVIEKYAAPEAVFEHRAILINVNRSSLEESSLYEATRYAWVISKSKAARIEVVLAVIQGIIRDAFIPERWLEATTKNFPDRKDVTGRMGFFGHPADERIRKLYVGKRVPDSYRKKGAANPIKYTFK